MKKAIISTQFYNGVHRSWTAAEEFEAKLTAGLEGYTYTTQLDDSNDVLVLTREEPIGVETDKGEKTLMESLQRLGYVLIDIQDFNPYVPQVSDANSLVTWKDMEVHHTYACISRSEQLNPGDELMLLKVDGDMAEVNHYSANVGNWAVKKVQINELDKFVETDMVTLDIID